MAQDVTVANTSWLGHSRERLVRHSCAGHVCAGRPSPPTPLPMRGRGEPPGCSLVEAWRHRADSGEHLQRRKPLALRKYSGRGVGGKGSSRATLDKLQYLPSQPRTGRGEPINDLGWKSASPRGLVPACTGRKAPLPRTGRGVGVRAMRWTTANFRSENHPEWHFTPSVRDLVRALWRRGLSTSLETRRVDRRRPTPRQVAVGPSRPTPPTTGAVNQRRNPPRAACRARADERPHGEDA
jgi:hypothetical protein